MTRKVIIILLLVLCQGMDLKASFTIKDTISDSAQIAFTLINPVARPNNTVTVGIESVDYVMSPNFRYDKLNMDAGNQTFKCNVSTPVLIDLSMALGKEFTYSLFEPGDSIIIDKGATVAKFRGQGSAKLKVLQQIAERLSTLPLPAGNPKFYEVNSVHDFSEWANYLDEKKRLINQTLSESKADLSQFAFGYIKANYLAEAEYTKILRFALLVQQQKTFHLTKNDLDSIFDSSLENADVAWLHGYSGYIRNVAYYYDYVRQCVLREFGYNWNNPVMKSAYRKELYAKLAKQIYKGYPYVSMMAFLLTNSGLKEHTLKQGYSPEIDTLLSEFLSMPGYPNYKEYVTQYEKKILSWMTGIGTRGYNFALPDSSGKVYKKDDFKGYLLVLNFTDGKSKKCKITDSLMKKIAEGFDKHSLIKFVTISNDPNYPDWIRELRREGHNSDVINLYNADSSKQAPLIKAYNIQRFPTIVVLDTEGKSIFNPKTSAYDDPRLVDTKIPDPTIDNGIALRDKLRYQLELLNDGPYVMIDVDSLIQLDFKDGSIRRHKAPLIGNDSILINIPLNRFKKPISVQIRDSFNSPESCSPIPCKLMVLSDIEGNLKSLTQLLIASHVMNDSLQWTFGEGHLVFVGDMFDRGPQVTECLWLLYSLEQQAGQAGGAVHFILGNHEIMNLVGDTRYVNEKYTRVSSLMEMPQKELYGNNAILGRWLRSKNIIEKIGPFLFVHAGISSDILKSKLSLDSINAVNRDYLKTFSVGDSVKRAITDFHSSPYWTRCYYENKLDSNFIQDLVDKTLKHFDVSMIVTGHTIVSDTISLHHQDKVINVDTKHAAGRSEALYIESRTLYRTDGSGNKFFLKQL